MPLRLTIPALPPVTEGEARWRLVLLLTLPLALLAFMLSVVLLGKSGQAATSFNQIAYPAMELGIVLAEVVLLVFRRAAHAVAIALINGIGVFLSTKLVFLLFFAPPYLYVYREITDSFFWIPSLYMLAFFMPEWRAVQRLCLAFMALMLAVAALAAPRLLAADDFNTLDALVQLVLANVVFLMVARTTISLLNARARHMEELALTDPLTGLYNRRFLHAHLPGALERARSTGQALALIFLDLDGFKEVNDVLGHAAGDALLRRVAQRLRQNGRAGELLVRVSGDEFVLLLPVATRAEAHARAQRAWAELNTSWAEVQVTASVGLSVYPHDAHTADALLSHADAAMYQVKNAGKNGVRPYQPDAAQALA